VARFWRFVCTGHKTLSEAQMAEPLNLKLYRSSSKGLRRSRRYQTTFILLAMPLAVGLGFVAVRTRRLRPLLSAFAVIGLARSAAHALRSRRHWLREERIDEAVEQSFPASDAPAF
jgi:hypothetical protein